MWDCCFLGLHIAFSSACQSTEIALIGPRCMFSSQAGILGWIQGRNDTAAVQARDDELEQAHTEAHVRHIDGPPKEDEWLIGDNYYSAATPLAARTAAGCTVQVISSLQKTSSGSQLGCNNTAEQKISFTCSAQPAHHTCMCSLCSSHLPLLFRMRLYRTLCKKRSKQL